MIDQIKRIQKTVVAACGAAATVGTVLAVADLSTVQGIIVAALGLLTSFGVYHVPNQP